MRSFKELHSLSVLRGPLGVLLDYLESLVANNLWQLLKVPLLTL